MPSTIRAIALAAFAVVAHINNNVAMAADPMAIDSLFHINLDNDDQYGSCFSHSDDFAHIVADAHSLAKTGLRALGDYDESAPTAGDYMPYAERLLEAFFRADPRNGLDYISTIQTIYTDVQNFLEQGASIGLNGNQRSTAQPYLYCGDSWGLRKSPNDQLIDANGIPAKHTDGTPFLISDDQDIMQNLQYATDSFREQAYPYFVEESNSYVIARSYGDLPDDGYCSSGGLGQTFPAASTGAVSIIVLCENSFTEDRLGSIALRPVADTDLAQTGPPDDAQYLDELTYDSLTMFHELIHLIFGLQNTVPPTGEVYRVDLVLQLPSEPYALANPETYTLVAVAYDALVRNGLTSPIPEFFTGFCTYKAPDDGSDSGDGGSS